MAKCGDCLHHSMCYLTHSPNSAGCCEFADKNRYVQVVRCKDCKNAKQSNIGVYCSFHEIVFSEDDFCSYGERREGEGEGE